MLEASEARGEGGRHKCLRLARLERGGRKTQMLEASEARGEGERQRQTVANCRIYLPTRLWAECMHGRHFTTTTGQDEEGETEGEDQQEEQKQRESNKHPSAIFPPKQGQRVGITQ